MVTVWLTREIDEKLYLFFSNEKGVQERKMTKRSGGGTPRFFGRACRGTVGLPNECRQIARSLLYRLRQNVLLLNKAPLLDPEILLDH